MRVVVVGGGPVGSLTAVMLARRGHRVLVVDRDPGPGPGGTWRRRGVMQFELPHFFRWMVREALCEEAPALWAAVLRAGGEPARPPGLPERLAGVQCRRSVLERAVWTATTDEPGVDRLAGHADGLAVEGGRVAAVVVSGARVDADLVVVATGRAGRLGDGLRAPGEALDCGFSYAARQYRARPGVDAPGWGMPRGHVHDGYLAIVFPQDARTLSALLVRPAADRRLAGVRDTAAFEAVAAAVPLLAGWTDPARFEPLGGVRAGHNLVNAYRGQRRPGGGTTPGVVFVGDAVLTTNPAAGRGVGLGMQQARALVGLLDAAGGPGADGAVDAFDAWCEETVRPWFDDHVAWDAGQLRRFAGLDVDLDARIPSDVVCACAQVDPSIMAAAGPYLGMLAGPRVLDAVQDKARAVLRTGWRPPYEPGPTGDELAGLVAAAA